MFVDGLKFQSHNTVLPVLNELNTMEPYVTAMRNPHFF